MRTVIADRINTVIPGICVSRRDVSASPIAREEREKLEFLKIEKHFRSS